MVDALGALGDHARRVQPLFISLHLARDTPEHPAFYVGHYHPALVRLTGTETQVRAAARADQMQRHKV